MKKGIITWGELNNRLATLDGGYVNVAELREFWETIIK